MKANAQVSGYDPLDPFSESREIYNTKGIRYSKAHIAKQKSDSLRKEIAVDKAKPKKETIFSRIVLFIKGFSEREDRKRIIFFSGITLALIVGLVSIYIIVIAPWEKETTIAKRSDDITELIEKRDEISEDEFEDKKDSYKEDLLNKLVKTEKGSEEEYLYLSSLAEIYYAENDYQNLAETTERELEYEGLSITERALKLYNLLLLYDSINDEKGVRECLERFYALPDENSTKVFEVNTLTEMKAILKERYPDE